MHNRLEICKPFDSDPKTQKYTVTLSLIDERAENFIAYLDNEYGLKSMNFVRGCGAQSMFWFKPTGSGRQYIKSCVTFQKIDNQMIILFGEKIKSIMEEEIDVFNNETKLLNTHYAKDGKYKIFL